MTNYYPDTRLLLFTKAPVLGQVKTRLAKDTGPRQALSVHKALLKHVVSVLKNMPVCPIDLWLDESTGQDFFAGFNIFDSVYYQQGSDLGERMAYAVEQTLVLNSIALIIGSDSPVIDTDYLSRALSCLYNKDSDIVIGPAEDGGYVLIGLRKFHRDIFANIDWGTGQVLQQTLQQIQRCGFSVTQLEELWDVDELADLQRFQQLTGLEFN